MASSFFKLFFLVALVAATTAEASSLSPEAGSLAARLKLDEESPNCWESLMQLQACTGELIMFFLNGEAYLGRGCCHAIRVISAHCWPAMIDTLGFTTEETDVLQGYCQDDEEEESPPAVGRNN